MAIGSSPSSTCARRCGHYCGEWKACIDRNPPGRLLLNSRRLQYYGGEGGEARGEEVM
jgi:hypothetical protein